MSSSALAFADGLRKNVATSGRRWAQWPGGADDLAAVIACIDGIRHRLQAAAATDDAAAVAERIADLRAILEWTTYQSGSIATARAMLFGRKTRAFANRLGLTGAGVSGLTMLADSEESLIENVRTRNGYMLAIAERNPHLDLPHPLVSVPSLMPKLEKPPGKLAFIQQLTKSAKR